MDRRQYIKMTGLGLAGLAGCTSTPPSTDPNNATTTQPATTMSSGGALAGYTVSESVETPNVEHVSDMDAWGVYIGSRAVADEYFHTSDENVAESHLAFIEETNFEHGETLIYVQAYGPQTCYALELEAPPTTTETNQPHIPLTIERTAGENESCGEAMTPVEILLRLAFNPDHGPSDHVAVTVNSDRKAPEELQLELETAVARS